MKTVHDGINHIGEKFGKLTILKLTSKDSRKTNNKRQRTKYLCKCECGVEKEILWESLRSGTTKSCGCFGLNRNTKPKGMAAFNTTFCVYKSSAKLRGLLFDLTKEEFKEITQKDCVYCGQPPSTIQLRNKMNGSYIYNGIDRIDSSKGYLKNNVVPCCETCNKMKLNYSVEFFENHICKIYDHLKDKKNV